MPKKQTNVKKNKKKIEDDDGAFHNSEDEYNSNDESDVSEDSHQSGGEAPDVDPENELDNDNSTLDIDPDDENDANEDDKYDPIDEIDEPQDPDDASDIEEEAEGAVEEGEIEDTGEAGEEAAEDDYAAETKQCHLKNLNKDFIVLDEDDSNMYGKMEYRAVPANERVTDKIMTYYEMVRIIGTRAQQFNLGAEPLIKDVEHLHPAKIAYLELIAKMTPFIIRRHLPGKKYEDFFIDELEIIHEITDDFFVPENFDMNSFMKQLPDNNTNDKSNNARVKSDKSNNTRVKSGKKSRGSKNHK